MRIIKYIARFQSFQLLMIWALAACTKEDAANIEYPCLVCPIDFNIIDSEPAWSPDGKWIAFVHADSMSEKSGIYLVSPDGQKIQQWHKGFAEAPAWSPDGKWMAFSENAQIWKKNINGDSLTTVPVAKQDPGHQLFDDIAIPT